MNCWLRPQFTAAGCKYHKKDRGFKVWQDFKRMDFKKVEKRFFELNDVKYKVAWGFEKDPLYNVSYRIGSASKML
jgi:hypothetical protein